MTLPLVSIIFLCYNQENTVAAAVRGCTSQDYAGPLEIIFSDDYSSDRTYEIVSDLVLSYAGPHTVKLFRNERNLGIGEHYNVAISRCSGDLIVTAAGDDVSLPNRVTQLVREWLRFEKKPDLITSDLYQINASGKRVGYIKVDDLSHWDKPEKWISRRPFVVGAAHMFTKKLHSNFGDFIPKIVYEDQIMTFRATLGGKAIKVNEPLVEYRVGGVSQKNKPKWGEVTYLDWCRKKYRRQAAQYYQILLDATKSAASDHLLAKIQRRLDKALFVLFLLRDYEYKDFYLDNRKIYFDSIIFKAGKFVSIRALQALQKFRDLFY